MPLPIAVLLAISSALVGIFLMMATIIEGSTEGKRAALLFLAIYALVNCIAWFYTVSQQEL